MTKGTVLKIALAAGVVAAAVAAGYGSRPADAGKVAQLTGFTVSTRSVDECEIDNVVEDQRYPVCNGTMKLTIPSAGMWRVTMKVLGYAHRPDHDLGTVEFFFGLSATPTGEPIDPELRVVLRVGGGLNKLGATLVGEKVLRFNRPTTLYMNTWESSGGIDQLEASGASPTIIRAERVG